jgi:hypothetical protein
MVAYYNIPQLVVHITLIIPLAVSAEKIISDAFSYSENV